MVEQQGNQGVNDEPDEQEIGWLRALWIRFTGSLEGQKKGIVIGFSVATVAVTIGVLLLAHFYNRSGHAVAVDNPSNSQIITIQDSLGGNVRIRASDYPDVHDFYRVEYVSVMGRLPSHVAIRVYATNENDREDKIILDFRTRKVDQIDGWSGMEGKSFQLTTLNYTTWVDWKMWYDREICVRHYVCSQLFEFGVERPELPDQSTYGSAYSDYPDPCEPTIVN